MNLKNKLVAKFTLLILGLFLFTKCHEKSILPENRIKIEKEELEQLVNSYPEYSEMISLAVENNKQDLAFYEQLSFDEHNQINNLMKKYSDYKQFVNQATQMDKDLFNKIFKIDEKVTRNKPMVNLYIKIIDKVSKNYSFDANDLASIVVQDLQSKSSFKFSNGRVECSDCRSGADMAYWGAQSDCRLSAYQSMGYVSEFRAAVCDYAAEFAENAYYAGCIAGCR